MRWRWYESYKTVTIIPTSYPFEEGFGHLSSEVNLQSSVDRFLLKTREDKSHKQLAVDGIVHDVTDLWQMGVKEVRIVFY